MKRDSGTHCDRSGETRHMFTHERRERERERDHLMATAAGFDHLERKCRPGERLTNSRRRLESRLRIDRVSETPRADGERERERERRRRRSHGEEEFRSSVRPSVRAAARESIIWSGDVVATAAAALRISASICHLLSATNSPSHADCAVAETLLRPERLGKKVKPCGDCSCHSSSYDSNHSLAFSLLLQNFIKGTAT